MESNLALMTAASTRREENKELRDEVQAKLGAIQQCQKALDRRRQKRRGGGIRDPAVLGSG